MKIDVIRTSELDSSLLRRWTDILGENPTLESPYFALEFTLAVGMVRDDVYVGVMREGKEVVGFFPFQRAPGGIGRPVGGPFSDRQGFIVTPGAGWSADELVRGCGLSLWQFDSVIPPQKQFVPWRQSVGSAPIVGLQHGYAAYAAARRQSRIRELTELDEKECEFEREVGPLRFEMHTQDTEVLLRLLDWKSLQYMESGRVDIFRYPWTQGLLERILAMQSFGFGGVLSALYADDCLAAVHLGLRTRSVWHYWFAACLPEFARYEPNLLLFSEMIRNAESMGFKAIDLGRDPEGYRDHFATGSMPLMEGCVDLPSFARTLRGLRRGAEDLMLNSPISPILRRPYRLLRHLETRIRFR